MLPRVLLVAATWRLRALLRAQLIEDGYEVTAVETWDEAELYLRTQAVRPDLVVFDLDGDDHPEANLRTLARLLPGRPPAEAGSHVRPGEAGTHARPGQAGSHEWPAGGSGALVLTAASLVPAEQVKALGLAHVMARPFRIQDVVERVESMLNRPRSVR